jgi:predicted MarR family transcription regulator
MTGLKDVSPWRIAEISFDIAPRPASVQLGQDGNCGRTGGGIAGLLDVRTDKPPELGDLVPSKSSVALSALEYTFITLMFGFSRWAEACMDAANVYGLSALDIFVLHAVNHRARGRRLSEICTVMNVGDSYLIAYSLKKLLAAGFIVADRRGRERHYSTTEDGDRACVEYRLVREEHLIRAFFSDPGVAAESAQVTRFLSRIIANYDQAGRAATVASMGRPKLPPLRTKR